MVVDSSYNNGNLRGIEVFLNSYGWFRDEVEEDITENFCFQYLKPTIEFKKASVESIVCLTIDRFKYYFDYNLDYNLDNTDTFVKIPCTAEEKNINEFIFLYTDNKLCGILDEPVFIFIHALGTKDTFYLFVQSARTIRFRDLKKIKKEIKNKNVRYLNKFIKRAELMLFDLV